MTYFREYDARLGRFWGIDPVTHEWESPYAAMGGDPISRVDPSGAKDTTNNPLDPDKKAPTPSTSGVYEPGVRHWQRLEGEYHGKIYSFYSYGYSTPKDRDGYSYWKEVRTNQRPPQTDGHSYVRANDIPYYGARWVSTTPIGPAPTHTSGPRVQAATPVRARPSISIVAARQVSVNVGSAMMPTVHLTSVGEGAGEGGGEVSSSVGAPGFWEGILPLWGSGRSLINAVQEGNFWGAVFHGFVFVTDVFLVKSVVTAGIKLIFTGGGAAIATRELAVHEGGVIAGESSGIVGETMSRVEAAAADIPGAKILDDMPDFSAMGLPPHKVASAIMQYNRQWILDLLRSGRPIIDIGFHPNRAIPSIYYQMERNMIKYYQILHPEYRGVIIR